jgi:F-type H+-transporting ATPase subunit c
MKGKIFVLLAILLALASPAMAQDGGGTSYVALTSGFAMALAAAGCGLGQGNAIAGAAQAMARNPSAIPAIRFALILGLVLIESLALYTLVIIFVKVV